MDVATDGTASVIAGMLVENTGRHMLDSGGAYGRSWERNSAVAGDNPLDFFESRPEVTVDRWGCISIDVYHFLSARLDFAPKLDRAWRTWVEMVPTTSYGNLRYYNGCETADEFAEQLLAKGYAESGADFAGLWVNTYNGEDALSQVIQYKVLALTEDCPFADNGEDIYVLLSIHGGCDVRGGYTDLRAFSLNGYDGICELFDNARLEAWSPGIDPPQDEVLFDENPDTTHRWYSDDAGYRWYGEDNRCNGEVEWDEDNEQHRCSECHAEVTICAPYAS